MTIKPETIYLVDGVQLERIKVSANRLCAGSDAMRDEGNALCALIWQIQDQETSENDEPTPDLAELRNTVLSLKANLNEIRQKHKALLRICLRHIKPQRVQYPWEMKELLAQREELINAIEMYLDLDDELQSEEEEVK